MNVLVQSPDGRRTPIRSTDLAPLADALLTVARGGEEAIFTWFLPVHRPPVEDVETLPDGSLVLNLLDTRPQVYEVHRLAWRPLEGPRYLHGTPADVAWATKRMERASDGMVSRHRSGSTTRKRADREAAAGGHHSAACDAAEYLYLTKAGRV